MSNLEPAHSNNLEVIHFDAESSQLNLSGKWAVPQRLYNSGDFILANPYHSIHQFYCFQFEHYCAIVFSGPLAFKDTVKL